MPLPNPTALLRHAGSYEIRDAAAVITGKLGTGYWNRSPQ
jgi:hypothetical protein